MLTLSEYLIIAVKTTEAYRTYWVVREMLFLCPREVFEQFDRNRYCFAGFGDKILEIHHVRKSVRF